MGVLFCQKPNSMICSCKLPAAEEEKGGKKKLFSFLTEGNAGGFLVWDMEKFRRDQARDALGMMEFSRLEKPFKIIQ